MLTLALLLVGQCAWATDLTTNLISAWEWNSTGADLVVASANNLTNNNSATFTSGKPAFATALARSGPQYWSKADNASLSMGDIDFTLCAWGNYTTNSSVILSKWHDGNTDWEYWLAVDGSNKATFFVRDAANANFVAVTSTGTIASGGWHFIVAWHDATANTINVQIDDGTADTVSHAGGVRDGTADFLIGAQNGGTANQFDGLIGQVLVYKRVLTAGEKTQLYNGGSGLAYASFVAPAASSNFLLFFSSILKRWSGPLTMTTQIPATLAELRNSLSRGQDVLKNIARRAARAIASQIQTRPPDETQLLALGTLLSNQQWSMTSNFLNDYEFKIFSQSGDDGIIQYLIKHLAIENESFIEFGVESYQESNTRFLMMHNNWHGFIMDASAEAIDGLRNQPWYWQFGLNQKSAFIAYDNINVLLGESGLENIGLLSIDIDGNDCWVLEAIDYEKINPAIIVIEYNSVFGPERPISVPYDRAFNRTKAHYCNLFWGASLAAMTHIANQKRYALVGSNKMGMNAYFVRRDLLNDRVPEQTVAEAYRESKFRDSRDRDFKLSYVSGNDRLELMRGTPVVNVVTGQTEVL